ncbi:MAG: AtpZ/AtpI family protein [Candidatus Eremiobacteraeota bacterium]|nr:AtpZ/AtpI family protein [Candidatus Eremiobacteraeota bacterium]MBV8373810.1 AtpZ/AtpI family protein [Candidatus Eremiobacteraeota bacterium]
MNAAVPVLAAGGTFAVATLAGLFAGFWLGRATGQAWWVIVGLVAGASLGGYSAFRLLLRSL